MRLFLFLFAFLFYPFYFAFLFLSFLFAFCFYPFYLFTILIKKPIGMYFFIDYAYAKGAPRSSSKALYSSSENYHHFVNFTAFLVFFNLIG